jgi:hypothetical protein
MTIDQIKDAATYTDGSQAKYYFKANAVKSFSSRCGSKVHSVGDKHYFVESCKYSSNAGREYKIMYWDAVKKDLIHYDGIWYTSNSQATRVMLKIKE